MNMYIYILYHQDWIHPIHIENETYIIHNITYIYIVEAEQVLRDGLIVMWHAFLMDSIPSYHWVSIPHIIKK